MCNLTLLEVVIKFYMEFSIQKTDWVPEGLTNTHTIPETEWLRAPWRALEPSAPSGKGRATLPPYLAVLLSVPSSPAREETTPLLLATRTTRANWPIHQYWRRNIRSRNENAEVLSSCDEQEHYYQQSLANPTSKQAKKIGITGVVFCRTAAWDVGALTNKVVPEMVLRCQSIAR